MIIKLRRELDAQALDNLAQKLVDLGVKTVVQIEPQRIALLKTKSQEELVNAINSLPEVEELSILTTPYILSNKEAKSDKTIVKVGNVEIGGDEVVVMAGPCAVESKEQLLLTAEYVKKAGAQVLRGGAYKPRTSPYSFQGLAEAGLKMLQEVREETGMPIITEVMDTRSVELVAKYTDILQIGTRNMQNYDLLREVGKTRKPVLLKRGMASTIEEWLMAAEYILSEGNPDVILCERGIRTYETYTRNTLDLSAIPAIKNLSHLPIIVDPSHATGNWKLVAPLSRAAVAAGADGLIIEVHPNPAEALCDGPQSLTPTNFAALMNDLQKITTALRAAV